MDVSTHPSHGITGRLSRGIPPRHSMQLVTNQPCLLRAMLQYKRIPRLHSVLSLPCTESRKWTSRWHVIQPVVDFQNTEELSSESQCTKVSTWTLRRAIRCRRVKELFMKAIMFAILSGVGGGKEKEEKQEEEEEELDAISRDCYVLVVVVECSAAANGLAISCTCSPVLKNSLFR